MYYFFHLFAACVVDSRVVCIGETYPNVVNGLSIGTRGHGALYDENKSIGLSLGFVLVVFFYADTVERVDRFVKVPFARVQTGGRKARMVGTVREHLCLQGNSRIGTVMLSAFPVGHVDVFTHVNLQAGVIRQDGKGRIEILLKAEDQESEFQYKTLLIKIRNIGKGIATDELPYIFNRFYENSFKQLGLKGNGIGLALTKSLVELHKGTISVTSELEEWTEFTIRIPINKTSYSNEQINETIEHRFIVNDSPEGAAIQQSQSNSEIQKSSKQNSVLVIEDDQDLRDSLQRLLQEKYTISMAANGEEGLKLVQEIKPDLILSDVMMPIMDGFELCKQLKRKKETSCIPIILLTAKINDKDYLEGLNCGADAYITKPFNFNVLQANIDMVISNRKRVIDSFKSNPLTQNIDITISSYDEKFLKEAMDIVKKNMENPEFDVKHFCEIMQVSNSMLYRKLKSLANMSPNEFIRSIRLNTAKELIKQRRGNVSDIAYLVGFKDAHYFSVCFKKEFNMTPGEYMETICS